jgi:hypothetical protein
MKCVLFALGIAAAGSAALTAAEPPARVVITGCVHDGTTRGAFILTDVKDLSTGQPTLPSVLYWLSPTRGLAAHVGEQVEVTGTVATEQDAGKTAKVTIEADHATGNDIIAVERSLLRRAESEVPRAVGTSGTKTEIKKPMRRLRVQTIRMIEPSCP